MIEGLSDEVYKLELYKEGDYAISEVELKRRLMIEGVFLEKETLVLSDKEKDEKKIRDLRCPKD